MSTLRQNLSEAWHARDMMLQLGRRDVRLRYRQTRLGPAWLAVGPVVSALLFTLVFNRIGRISSGSDAPYFVFALSGLAAWTAFSQATLRVSSSFLNSSALVTRVRFPRLILPGAAVVAATADAFIGFSIALVVAGVADPGPRLLLGLVGAAGSLLLIELLAWELGLLVAVLAVRDRDLVQALPIALQLGMFASPVAYPPGAVPHSFRWLVELNPIAAVIQTFRACLFGSDWPTPLQLVVLTAVAVGLLVLALWRFTRVEPVMADIL